MADDGAPLPLTVTTRVAIADRAVSFDDVNARLGGTTLRGSLAVDGQKLSGALEADTVDAAPLIAAAIGMPAAGKTNGAAWAWSSEPFAGGVFGERSGEVALKARQVGLLPRLTAREFRATLRLKPNGFAVDDISGAVAGGRLTGALSFQSAQDGLKTHAKLLARRRRCGEPAALRRAAAGRRHARFVGRARRRRLEPRRADRFAARLGQDRARRRADCRPRSARFRRGDPCGRPRAADRRRAYFRCGEQGTGQRRACGQARRRRALGERRANSARQGRRRRQGRGIVDRRRSRPHRRFARRAAGAVGRQSSGWRAARYLHGVEGTAHRAKAQHRRVGIDGMADVARGGKPGAANPRDGKRAAPGATACRRNRRANWRRPCRRQSRSSGCRIRRDARRPKHQPVARRIDA